MIHLKSFELAELQIENSIFNIFVNPEYNEIHILDLDKPESRSVTNNAHTSFFVEINQYLKDHFNECFPYSIINYELYLYGTDGIVCRYCLERESFIPVEPFAALYEPYNAIMRERYANKFLDGETPGEKRKWPMLLAATDRAEVEAEQEIERQAETDYFKDINIFD